MRGITAHVVEILQDVRDDELRKHHDQVAVFRFLQQGARSIVLLLLPAGEYDRHPFASVATRCTSDASCPFALW
jgi:hypothetical protein